MPSQRSGSRNDSPVPIDSSPPTSEPEDEPVDLTTCLNVSFELRDGQYKDSNHTTSWTPVVGRQKKQPQLPPYILCRFPPNHPLQQSHTSRCNSDSSSDEEVDEDLVIPQTAVYYDVVGHQGYRSTQGTPPDGLQ